MTGHPAHAAGYASPATVLPPPPAAGNHVTGAEANSATTGHDGGSGSRAPPERRPQLEGELFVGQARLMNNDGAGAGDGGPGFGDGGQIEAWPGIAP
jgi:hypothetical protein